MNEQLRPTSMPFTTQAAEGRRFTVAEIESMAAKGILAEDERLELIGGELVPMSPKGTRHERIHTELAFQMTRLAPETLRVASEAQPNLADDAYAMPAILVYPASIKVDRVRGPATLLVIEIADGSLAYDLNTKADLYAGYGVREYCVVDGRTMETKVHRDPSAAGYGSVADVPSSDRLVPQAAPELAVLLSSLDLD